MQEVNLEEFKTLLNDIKDRYMFLQIKGLINTTYIIESATILMNNFRIIVTDKENQDIEINVETVDKFSISKNKNVFILEIDKLNIVKIQIDKVS